MKTLYSIKIRKNVMIFYDGGTRQKGTLVRKIFQPSRADKAEETPSSNPSIETQNKKTKNAYNRVTKKSEREREKSNPPPKNKKKQKKNLFA